MKCGCCSFFLNSANLIRRNTDISKYFRESLGLRDNESRLYKYGKTKNSNNDGSFTVADSKSFFSKKFFRQLKKINRDILGKCYCENVCCMYALELPHRGDSNEYTQHTIIL